MSFKFERDTYKQTEGGVAGVAGAAASAVADARDQLLGRDGPIPGTSGKHPIREAIGTAITGGKQNAGTKGYLAVCLLPRVFLWPAVVRAHIMSNICRYYYSWNHSANTTFSGAGLHQTARREPIED